MVEFHKCLALLRNDPANQAPIDRLMTLEPEVLASAEAMSALEAARLSLRDTGALELAMKLLEVEIANAPDQNRRADLLLAKGQLYADDLLDPERAGECFEQVLSLRPQDGEAQEWMARFGFEREHWQRFVEKYLVEAEASTDKQLTTAMYLAAAETCARYGNRGEASTTNEVEQCLRKALAVEPGNWRAFDHLERLLRRTEQWDQVLVLLQERLAFGPDDKRVKLLVAIAHLAGNRLDKPDLVINSMKRVLAIEPNHRLAVNTLQEHYTVHAQWDLLADVYAKALKAQRRSQSGGLDLGLLLEAAMLQWKQLRNYELAEEYFRRLRKVDPNHSEALEFCREYSVERNEFQKLFQILRQAYKALPAHASAQKRALSVEMAEVAEKRLGHPDKAIDAWKMVLRTDSSDAEARQELKRLYGDAGKWNALLDILKEEVERLPATEVESRVELLMEMLEIYRDHLKLDVMVINTYDAILKLDPNNRLVIEELALRYEQLSRWSDLIKVLEKKAALDTVPVEERAQTLRRVAELWTKRFGNHSQAAKPLARLLELVPSDEQAIAELKDIYTRRRQWRPLVALMQQEADAQPPEKRRPFLISVARMASERLGDHRLATHLWNQCLELAPEDGEALLALAGLYEREKRYLQLVEVLRRRRALAADDKDAIVILERIASVLVDRLKAQKLAAETYQEIVDIDPTHSRALRTLRTLLAAAGDLDALEKLYGRLGHWDDLVEVLFSIAERTPQEQGKLAVLERCAAIATEHVKQPDKIVRVLEHVLSLAPGHAESARSLVPIYEKAHKWSRLLQVYQVVLEDAAERQDKLEILLKIFELCDKHMSSTERAFPWGVRALTLDPGSQEWFESLVRVGGGVEDWQQVVAIYQEYVEKEELSQAERVSTLRKLGEVAKNHLQHPKEAQSYFQRILEETPEDEESLVALEDIATSISDWPATRDVYERRVKLANEVANKLSYLFRIAFIDAECVNDMDGAIATYHRILELQGDSRQALSALAKIHEVRQSWSELVEVLTKQLEVTPSEDEEVATLQMRLGVIYEHRLQQPDKALPYYRKAWEHGADQGAVSAALERYLGDVYELSTNVRIEIAQLLISRYQQEGDAAKVARALEVLRLQEDEEAALACDRQLLILYGQKLHQKDKGYEAGIRVLFRDPTNSDNRNTLCSYAAAIDREADLTQHYWSVLEALQEKGDVDAVRVLGGELAQLYEDNLGKIDDAEAVWDLVLEAEPHDRNAFDALQRIYNATQNWQKLRALLVRGEELASDSKRRKTLLFSICELDETVLDNRDAAVENYQRILDMDPQDAQAFEALDRICSEKGQWGELEKLLENRIGWLTSEETRMSELYRLAALRVNQLDNPSGALGLLEEIVGGVPKHVQARELLQQLLVHTDLRMRIARILEPLYREDGLWRELCEVLRAQLSQVNSSVEAVEVLAEIARVEEQELADYPACFHTWKQTVLEDPSDFRARENLTRLAAHLGQWDEVIRTYEQVLERDSLPDSVVTTELLVELANVYDLECGNAQRATENLERALAQDPDHPQLLQQIVAGLEKLYEREERWSDLIRILRLKIDRVEESDERCALLARVANICQLIGNAEEAVGAWQEVLLEKADDTVALDSLEKLHEQTGAYTQLVDILTRRARLTDDRNEQKSYLIRVAKLLENQGQASDAVDAYREVLDLFPEDPNALEELARLYQITEQFDELASVLEQRLNATEESEERTEVCFQLASVLDRLGRKEEALLYLAEILTWNPRHERTLDAIESMIEEETLRSSVIDVLQPVYRAEGAYERLANLFLRVVGNETNSQERLRYLREVIELRERYLQDKDGAFEVTRMALKEPLSDAEAGEMIAMISRLAAELGREQELIEIYRQAAPNILEGDLQRRLFLDIADLARALRKDQDLAHEYYQRVLDIDPNDRRALNALEEAYRKTEAHEELNEVLLRKAALEEEDVHVRVAALCESARICAQILDRPEQAISAWEQVLELAPQNVQATTALDGLYAQANRFHDLVDVLERRLGFVDNMEEAVRLRYRLGGLYRDEMSDPEAAIMNYSAALGGDPNHVGATKALEAYLDDPLTRNAAAEVLEPVYVSYQDWRKLVRIYEIKRDACEYTQERLEATRHIARLYEEQLEDLEGAFLWYGKVFRETPEDSSVRDQLARLATVLEDWKGLADVYQEFLDDQTGDSSALREIGLVVAEIYDQRLNDTDCATIAYQQVLRIAPDDMDTFFRLEEVLSRAGQWTALIDVYEEAALQTSDDQFRLDLYLRIAAVHDQKLKDHSSAIDAYRTVLDTDASNQVALDQLERLYEEKQQWLELAELLAFRIDNSSAGQEIIQFRMKLAGILEEHLEDVSAAVDHYEKILASQFWQEAVAPLERLVLNEDCRIRIAQMLEPVYRAQDWWRKLVIILDAQLEYVEDQVQLVGMLREIAKLHEERGGNLRLALKALARAWKQDPSQTEVYAELLTMANRLAAWDGLVDTLEAGVAEVYEPALSATLWQKIAEIQEEKRQDYPRAVHAWQQVLETNGEDISALCALDRLYGIEERFEELVDVLERRALLIGEEGVHNGSQEDVSLQRRELLLRAARTRELELQQTDEAIAAYRGLLDFDPFDPEVLDALQRLYETTEAHLELVEVLVTKIELAESALEKKDLRLMLVEVYDEKLNDSFEAISQLNALLDINPQDEQVLVRLGDLYAREAMWEDLIQVLDRRVVLPSSGEQRAQLAFQAAKLVESELLDSTDALSRYIGVLDIERGHVEARAALESLCDNEDTMDAAIAALENIYRQEESFGALANLYERRLSHVDGDLDQRRALYARLGQVQEVLCSDGAAAFQVWARALSEMPEDVDVQGQLERLAGSTGDWSGLAELFEEQLNNTEDAELEYVYATKLATLYEEAMGDLQKAAEQHQRALHVAPDEREPLAALERIYRRLGQVTDLADVLRREAEVSQEEGEQCDFFVRLGELLEQGGKDYQGAVDAYREVLERNPKHESARASLERLQRSLEDYREEILSILEPLYENEEDYGRLIELLLARLGVTQQALDRAQLYARVAEIAEVHLGDSVRALDAAGGWLAEDPESIDALAQLERLAGDSNRWAEFAVRLSGIIDYLDSNQARESLLAKLGEVQLLRLGELDNAEATFAKMLKVNEDSEFALMHLEKIYRQRGDADRLAMTLLRRGESLVDGEEKRDVYVEVAQIREQKKDFSGAVEAWRVVLDLNEADREAYEHLAVLYERMQQWHPLVDILKHACRFAVDEEEERLLRTRVARVYTDMLEDSDDMIEAWQSVLDVAPEAMDALSALEEAYQEREDWPAVVDILLRRLDVAGNASERIRTLERLADVAYDKQDSIDDAISYLYQILEIDNVEETACSRLESYLRQSERWHDLIELFSKVAEVYTQRGLADRGVEYWLKTADVWEEGLESPEEAREVLEQVLETSPSQVSALTRLAKIYEMEEDWARCGEILQRALAIGPVGAEAADLYYRLGEVERQQTGDIDQVLSYFRQALRFQDTHPAAVNAVCEHAEQVEDWPTVANMLERQIAAAEDSNNKRGLLIRLASLYRERTGQQQESIQLLEQARDLNPEDSTILTQLADSYLDAARYDEATTLYEGLAAQARKKRKMKDVARYRQRLGRLYEANDALEDALAAYEEAFRIHPTDVPTMVGLGRIYLQREEWDKARRTYRSLVLQNLDEDAGITKDVVYYNLGKIHLALGEVAKAKGMFQRGLAVDSTNGELKQALEALR